MKTSAEIMAEIDAFDLKMWTQVNCSVGRPSDWLDYCNSDQAFREYGELCAAYANALEQEQ
jgi:hypothetical protein